MSLKEAVVNVLAECEAIYDCPDLLKLVVAMGDDEFSERKRVAATFADPSHKEFFARNPSVFDLLKGFLGKSFSVRKK